MYALNHDAKVGISEASSEAMNVVAEQRKMLDGIKADAARLGEKDATKDDHFLQVAGSVVIFARRPCGAIREGSAHLQAVKAKIP